MRSQSPPVGWLFAAAFGLAPKGERNARREIIANIDRFFIVASRRDSQGLFRGCHAHCASKFRLLTRDLSDIF
jgi:hypothetical protein